MTGKPTIGRRAVLGAGAASVVALGAGATALDLLSRRSSSAPATTDVLPDSRAVAQVEAARYVSGDVGHFSLRPQVTRVDLGGRVVSTWTYGGQLPAAPIRVKTGDRVMVDVRNAIEEPTSVHWHGLALRNNMDGVPGLTQNALAPHAVQLYDYMAPHSGTYWFHPHYDVQLDTGLYGPLIIDDPHEPGEYDQEVVLMLDDWTDGWGSTPDEILDNFRSNGMASMQGDMGGMDMGGASTVSAANPLGTDTGDVRYPAHLINGRLPADAYVIRAQPKQRLRLRVINAGSDTAYRFAIAGHLLTVTHADGYPVKPVDVDTLIIGMGERYDLLVTVGDGTVPVVAAPEGKPDPRAYATLTTSTGAVPSPSTADVVKELQGHLLSYADLQRASAVGLAPRSPDRRITMTLQMGSGGREWLINGKTYSHTEPIPVEQGERVRLQFVNQSTMFHPMHLHGHTYQVVNAADNGPRKDTINVLPMQRLSVDFDADNPGQWLAHCHNLYHGELGMMTVLSYVEPR